MLVELGEEVDRLVELVEPELEEALGAVVDLVELAGGGQAARVIEAQTSSARHRDDLKWVAVEWSKACTRNPPIYNRTQNRHPHLQRGPVHSYAHEGSKVP